MPLCRRILAKPKPEPKVETVKRLVGHGYDIEHIREVIETTMVEEGPKGHSPRFIQKLPGISQYIY